MAARYNVRVFPHAKKNRVVEEPGRLKVYLTAPPVEGKANALLLEVLAEHFKIKRNKLQLVRGSRGRDKVVELAD